MSNVAITRIGEWGKVIQLIQDIKPEMEKARELSLKRWALKAEALAKEHISNQDLGWTPLKPLTIARKVKKSYSTNILVETSTYFKNITSFVDTETAYAGVTRNVIEDDGTLVADIARVHEFGSISGNIPARPLWGRVIVESMFWHAAKNQPATIFGQRMMRKYRNAFTK